jgi:hypothetical protein
MPRFRRGTLVAVAVAVTVGVGGAASAVWTASGGGTGGADAGALQPITLSSGTPAAPLFPGGQTSVDLTVTNPNDANAKIGSIALDTSQGSGGFAVDAGHAGCTLSTLSFTTQTNGGAGWVLPPRVGAVDGTLAISLSNALSMSTSAANACQGATFTIYLVAGP